jgi:hypothetical protein
VKYAAHRREDTTMPLIEATDRPATGYDLDTLNTDSLASINGQNRFVSRKQAR